MQNLIAGIITAIAFALFICLMAILFAVPTMLLWDWLMPPLFGLKTITLLQAWGINVLSGLLFKSKSSSSSS